jgi:uncharacterized protein YndB with AHSA1/START domain
MPRPKDRVERETFMRASIERVFAALTDPSLFPTWGPERVEGTIAVGERPVLDFGPSGKVRVYIVALDAPRHFAYRWVQGNHDPAVLLGDPLEGTHTLVEFHLDEREGGTRVRVVESGLDKLPHLVDTNIDEALDNMGKGWELMLGGLPRHFTFAGGDHVEDDLTLAAPRGRVHGLLVKPASWWFFAPELEVSSPDDRHVTYGWQRDGSRTRVGIELDDAAGGTRLRLRHTGLSSAFDVKRAHQAWGAMLGMLQMALAA